MIKKAASEKTSVESEREFVDIARARIAHAEKVAGASPVKSTSNATKRLRCVMQARRNKKQFGLFDDDIDERSREG